jgi:hypothetical protein
MTDQVVHRVRQWENDGRYEWECDCGIGGSTGDQLQTDLASDKHIPEEDMRIDVY